jgi:taurine transport system substrate-binding protein
MRKIISFILGTIVALNLSISVANSAANEVRVAYFLEWPSPNLEDMQKKAYAKALGSVLASCPSRTASWPRR